MRDSKPQRCVQHQRPLEGTHSATNGDQQINETPKQTFANNLFKASCRYSQGMLSDRRNNFNFLKRRNYEFFCAFLAKLMTI